MAEVLISLLPMIIGSALVPLQIIMVILLLTGEKQGPLKAIMFVLGMTLARILQGLLFAFVLGDSGDVADDGPATIRSTLLLVLGILLLITAYKSYRNEPDPDAPPPKWLTMLEGASPLMSLAMGGGLILIAAKLWVFTLGALSTIRTAGLDQTESTIAFLLFILLAQSLLIIPILIRLLFPAKAGTALGTFGDWLEAHNSQIVVVVSLVFGALFLYQGVTGLLG
jgi:hypothetical protein